MFGYSIAGGRAAPHELGFSDHPATVSHGQKHSEHQGDALGQGSDATGRPRA